MNLSGVAANATRAVSPAITGTLHVSEGSETLPNGKQQPRYRVCTGILIDVQPLSANDLKHMDGLNIQGVTHAVYLNGEIDAVARARVKGGDLLEFSCRLWLVVAVIESWNGSWTKVAVSEQVSGV